jgi:hypothetical protein
MKTTLSRWFKEQNCLYRNNETVNLENTLVIEIQKGILLFIILMSYREEIKQDIKHKKVKMRRRDAGNYVDKRCTIT